ncbi:hypothetical protein Tco_0578409 [Tanacetum coccineum]
MRFAFKTSLGFALRPHCVLLQDLIAFCFKLSLRFASTSLRFAQDLHCVLLEDHIANSDDIQAAGSDTRPHMLDRTDYESWSQRIRLPRTYEDLSNMEKKRYDADVRATNIVLQGLPKDIYKLINHNIEAKAIWDNFHQYPSSSTNPQSPQYHIPDTAQINSDTLQTDEILDINQKMGAPGPYTFRATLPQTNNQLQTSSNTRNQATIQDGQVVVQNVPGRL